MNNWKGMPEFVQNKVTPYLLIFISFENGTNNYGMKLVDLSTMRELLT